MGTFGDRMEDLARRVGSGELVGRVEVNQVYAKYQHERLDLRHPRGGQAKYLYTPLMMKWRQYLHHLAEDITELPRRMADNAEDLSDQVFEFAPREFHDLRRSGHPSVKDAGSTVYDRPPTIWRLSESELRVKNRLRAQGWTGAR